ncbi:uncharacterized protein V1518DRAFT_422191 [Limtongia smithiae]|uniref:uncharacterized protein n=1 Tax=Limtongia smithiae TaxID=1125753 RepID=UPI0034CD998A
MATFKHARKRRRISESLTSAAESEGEEPYSDSEEPSDDNGDNDVDEDEEDEEEEEAYDSGDGNGDGIGAESVAEKPTLARDYNVNYLTYLNHEIEEFLNPGSTEDLQITDLELRLQKANEPAKSDVSAQDSTNGEALVPTSEAQQSSRRLGSSYVNGRTHWSKQEKEKFFELLGRKSRHNPAGIARGMETKTTFECIEYIALLERGLEKIRLREQRRRAAGMRIRWHRLMTKLPSARVMSTRWIQLEEYESQRVENYRAALEKDRDRRAWERSHPRNSGEELGLPNTSADAKEVSIADIRRAAGQVDRYSASLLEQYLGSHEDEEYENVSKAFSKEFQLLNVEKMLELSRRLYYNRRNLSPQINEYLHLHSFQVSSMQLFRDLVEQFARRLCAAALTVADTRLRVSYRPGAHPKLAVRRKDIEVACTVVGAESNTRMFWEEFFKRNPNTRKRRKHRVERERAARMEDNIVNLEHI